MVWALARSLALLVFFAPILPISPAQAFPAPFAAYSAGESAIQQVKSSKSKGGDVYVRGYTRKNGTYVQPHMRSAPNGSKLDNWSTKGNVNPYTGKPGTKNPYPAYQSVPASPSGAPSHAPPP